MKSAHSGIRYDVGKSKLLCRGHIDIEVELYRTGRGLGRIFAIFRGKFVTPLRRKDGELVERVRLIPLSRAEGIELQKCIF